MIPQSQIAAKTPSQTRGKLRGARGNGSSDCDKLKAIAIEIGPLAHSLNRCDHLKMVRPNSVLKRSGRQITADVTATSSIFFSRLFK